MRLGRLILVGRDEFEIADDVDRGVGYALLLYRQIGDALELLLDLLFRADRSDRSGGDFLLGDQRLVGHFVVESGESEQRFAFVERIDGGEQRSDLAASEILRERRRLVRRLLERERKISVVVPVDLVLVERIYIAFLECLPDEIEIGAYLVGIGFVDEEILVELLLVGEQLVGVEQRILVADLIERLVLQAVLDLHEERRPLEHLGIFLATEIEEALYSIALVVGVEEVFRQSFAESAFVHFVALDGIVDLLQAGIILGDAIDEEAVQEIAEIMVACQLRYLTLEDAREIEIAYERLLERQLYAGERLAYGDLLSEDEGVHEILEFARIVFPSREIAHRLDGQRAIEIEVSRHYESFVADEVIDGFDEACFGLEVALEDVDLEVVGLYVLLEEFAEFRYEPGLLQQERIVPLEDGDARGFGEQALEEEESYDERNEKNEVVKEESRYSLVGAYDFCLVSFHPLVPDKWFFRTLEYTVFSVICQNNLHGRKPPKSTPGKMSIILLQLVQIFLYSGCVKHSLNVFLYSKYCCYEEITHSRSTRSWCCSLRWMHE